MSHGGNVNVICRFRPFNDLEKANGNEQVCEFTSPTSLTFYSTREKNKYRFNFDRIFSPASTQNDIYDFGVKGIIDSVLEGYNGTVLAYGQTGSGKTYTMQGKMENDETKGIIPRMIEHVFKHIREAEDTEFMLKVSMVEIYLEKIRDLIDTSKFNLPIREDSIKGIYIDGVSETYVGNPHEVLTLLEVGANNRAQAATNMNEHSSRSHSIFILTINQNNKREGGSKTGKLYLVDLAGSEKISKTGAQGHTLEEAKIINKSLTTLGRVINNLTDGKSAHIPYRESKLTRVLQESLGGNSKTCLIITCSPSTYNESESLSTLRFGERAKKIKNKAKINKEVTVAELQKIIGELKEKLRKADARITQLENYIRQSGLKLPDSNYQVEMDEEEKSKKKDEKERIADEERRVQELTKKFANEQMPLGERINKALELLADNDDSPESRAELIASLKTIKEKYETREKQLNNNNANNNNGKLKITLNQNANKGNNNNNNNANNTNPMNQTSGSFSSSTTVGGDTVKFNSNNLNLLTKMHEGCTRFVTRLQDCREIQENPNLVKYINSFQTYMNKINSYKSTAINEGVDSQGAQADNGGNAPAFTEKKSLEDKEIQTEKLVDEIDKIKEDFEKEKQILYKSIDDGEQKLAELKVELTRLEERNKALEEREPIDEKRLKEKNFVLESNLKEMRKKLEESQVRRLMAENQNNVNVKAMREKNNLIMSLEKEIEELKQQGNAGPKPAVGNMIKIIASGKK